jgi:hypothetical protein
MPKTKKAKKTTKVKEKKVIKDIKADVKPIPGEEEETEKEGGALSDGVLDAFEEVTPVDPLLEDETAVLEEEEEDDIDSGDYRDRDEW